MSEADDLRKEISKARERVTRKIARNRREKGITQLSGSEYDPRIPHTELKSYSVNELKIVLYEYKAFVSRENQFVPGKRGQAFPAHEFDTVNSRVAALKAKAEEWQSVVGQFKLPHGDTVEHAFGMLGRRETANQSFSPYPIFNRSSKDFSSLSAVRNFEEKSLSKHNIDEWEAESVRSSREHYAKIQEVRGEDTEDVDNLTDFQFMVLWHATNFLTDLGIIYDTFKTQNDETKQQRFKKTAVENATKDVNRLVEWSGSLPESIETYREQVAAEEAKKQAIRDRRNAARRNKK